jgi:hypothetical protein
VPLREAVLEEGASGRLDTVFRALRLTEEELRLRFPGAALPPSREEDGAKLRVVEAAWPDPRSGHRFAAVLDTEDGPPVLLASGLFAENPFVAFRWLKLPGETYGRGPVAKALPDIRTANKVVELILKNASIAATGIWQAEDDGVLNPATIRLVPGAIIPKAAGSAAASKQRSSPAVAADAETGRATDSRRAEKRAVVRGASGDIGYLSVGMELHPVALFR